jgi:hypothetical protein
MIIPQMQQRYTGYSSEGANNLLNAVMGARRASVMERQQAVNEEIERRNREDYNRRVEAGKQAGAYRKAQTTAMEEQTKIKEDRTQAGAYNANSKLYNAAQWFNDNWNPFAPSQSSRARQESNSIERTRNNPMPKQSDYLGDEYYQNLPTLSPEQYNTFYPQPQSLLMNLNLNK